MATIADALEETDGGSVDGEDCKHLACNPATGQRTLKTRDLTILDCFYLVQQCVSFSQARFNESNSVAIFYVAWPLQSIESQTATCLQGGMIWKRFDNQGSGKKISVTSIPSMLFKKMWNMMRRLWAGSVSSNTRTTNLACKTNLAWQRKSRHVVSKFCSLNKWMIGCYVLNMRLLHLL